MIIVRKAKDIKKEEVGTGAGIERQILIGPSDGARNFILRCFTIGPGGSMPLHTNSVEHGQYVLSGRARVVIGGEDFMVEEGDVVFIPGGVEHSYETLGEEPFVFLCVVPADADRITILDSSSET
ncbi:MAG: cupin domain-containing protein [Candidatus Hydrogenedentota bacterium]|nr:MAG: cupin domain-containing protein [Candidatus Hydrogenedentota bacterium]